MIRVISEVSRCAKRYRKPLLPSRQRHKAYTNLGLLLSDQCVHTVKVAVFEGREKTVFKDRREFSGSLLKQLKDIYEFIDRYNSVRSEIKGLHRLDRRDYPSEAIREALLNALVHRDYSFRDSTLIGIFDDRIEIISIGGLVKGISYDDITVRILKGLVDAGKIRVKGRGKNTRYTK